MNKENEKNMTASIVVVNRLKWDTVNTTVVPRVGKLKGNGKK